MYPAQDTRQSGRLLSARAESTVAWVARGVNGPARALVNVFHFMSVTTFLWQ